MKRSNGEGTIYKRNDGRWCAAYYDVSPSPRRHFVYGKTQAEVKQKMKEKRKEPYLQNSKQADLETLEEWVLYFLENYKMIIPGLFEPPVRTLRATIPENESHIFR